MSVINDVSFASKSTGHLTADKQLPAAVAYNAVGATYSQYADGPLFDLLDVSKSSYSDRVLWATMTDVMDKLYKQGNKTLRVIDAGCGPGTWVRRVVAYGKTMGFTSIEARGFDIASDQVDLARQLSIGEAAFEGVRIKFELADLTQGLPEEDGCIDLILCTYTVMNHIDTREHAGIASEFGRVLADNGHLIVTVRSVASVPTAYVDDMRNVRLLSHDFKNALLSVELNDGRNISIPSYLFTSEQIEATFLPFVNIQDIRAMDIFLSRFKPDPRWNNYVAKEIPCYEKMRIVLESLEETYCRDIGWRDFGNQILLIGCRKS